MGARFRSWRQKIRQHRVAIAITSTILVASIALIIIGYRFDTTGFNGYTQVSTIHTLSGPTAGTVTKTEMYQPGKTLWDWLQLLIIPVVLAIGGYSFSFTTSRNERKAADRHNQTEREIAQDNQHETVLQEYIDKMSELLLHEKLRESQPEDEVRTIARVRTLTTLHRLDTVRKGNVLQFLLESKLIDRDKSIVDLEGADLHHANLSKAYLGRANLSHANLSQADMSVAILGSANLTYADLNEANLREAKLPNADLSDAKLNRADLQYADLRGDTLLRFTDLIQANLSHADLKYADLTGANLKEAELVETYFVAVNLSQANLERANLRKAVLRNANMSEANLTGADLREANFKGTSANEEAYIEGANLGGANLGGAKITPKQLRQARSLKGAIMPDGSIHP